MKHALANFCLRLNNWLDPVAAADRARTARRCSQLLEENMGLHERNRQLEIVVPPLAPDWLTDNASALKTFLDGHHGQTLSKRLRSIVAVNAINGSRNTTHTAHSAGVSAGWDEAVRYLHSLSRVARDQTPQPNATPLGETEIAELYSP